MRDKNPTLVYLKEVLGVRYVSRNLGNSRYNPHQRPAQMLSAKQPMPSVTKDVSLPAEVSPAALCSSLGELQKNLHDCSRCKLSTGRTNIVFGAGSPKAEIMFVGEAPGEQEDLQGVPFIGRAGQLLTKMIEAMGLSRDTVYIANVVKCRPPNNRNPEPDEIESCSPFLKAQVDLIKPKVIVALGTFAAQTLLQTESRISDLRGRIYNYQGRDLIATFHPAYLLRNPSAKKDAWEDLKTALTRLKGN